MTTKFLAEKGYRKSVAKLGNLDLSSRQLRTFIKFIKKKNKRTKKPAHKLSFEVRFAVDITLFPLVINY